MPWNTAALFVQKRLKIKQKCHTAGKTGREKRDNQEKESQVPNENGEHIAINRLVF